MRPWPIVASLLVLILSSPSHAQSLWQFGEDSAPTSPGVQLPTNAINPVAVTISGSLMESLMGALADDMSLSLTLPDGSALQYRIEQTQRYPGGDLGVRARLTDNEGPYVLSLTRGSEALLATLYAPSGKYRLQAQREGENFAGYLFQESDAFRSVPMDAGHAQGTGSALEVSSSDISIEQLLSTTTLLVGQTLDVTVRVTNQSNATISGETLKIIFTLDRTDYLDSTGGCTVNTVQYDSGPARELHCPVNDLTAGATLSIDYSVRMTTASLPEVPSTVILDNARDDEFVFVANDVLTDTDNDGISDFNETLLGTNINNSTSGPAEGSNVDIDLLLLYTPEYVKDIATNSPLLELNQLIQQTNDMYATSGIGLTFRPVAYRQVNYTVTNGVEAALDAMAKKSAPFQDLDYYRSTSGADLVVLIDGIYSSGDACGIAQSGGFESLGDLTRIGSRGIYTALFMPGVNAQSDAECDVQTLAHELGHLLGLAHSRVEGSGGTFPWALGHGVNGLFRTIMAYDTHFPDSEGLPVFSNPDSSNCKGQACGISQSDTANGANSVLALRTTRFQIGRYVGTRPALSVATGSGASTSASMSGGVIRTGGVGGPAASFGTQYSPADPLSLVTSITVDPAHVGRTGTTHIVIAAAGIGLFQVNSSGGYVPWDGNPGTLLGTVQPQALQSIEELTAFRDLSFGSLGIPSVSLTVYFAYSVTSSGELVFSGTGVPVVIQ